MSSSRRLLRNLYKTVERKTETLKRRLEELDTKLKDNQIFTFENLRRLQECEYVFSPWNMPEMTEEEIVEYFPNLKAIFYAG